MFVAAARALESARAEPLAARPYAEVFCRAAGGEWADVVDGMISGSHGTQLLDGDFGGYFVSFQGARTKYFDEYFAKATRRASVRSCMIAAGLDSRAYRLPWSDGTVLYEIDQPKVLDFKRNVLAEPGDAPRAERREVAVDLRDDWAAALPGADSTRPRPRPGSPRAC